MSDPFPDVHVPFDLATALSGVPVLLERGIDYEELPRLKHILLIAAARKGLRLQLEELWESEEDEHEWCVVVKASPLEAGKKFLTKVKYRGASTE